MKSPFLKRQKLTVIILLLLGALLAFWWGSGKQRGGSLSSPEFSSKDIKANGDAGKIERVSGQAWGRAVHASDLPANATLQLTPGTSAVPELKPLTESAMFPLPFFFHVAKGSFLQIVTEGNWIIGMDGEGDFLLEDALTNADRTVHQGVWFVKSGTFRAKPHDYDPSVHTLIIQTAAGKVFADRAEIGMRISEGGRGQVWLMSGKGKIEWNDGKTQELVLKGMVYL